MRGLARIGAILIDGGVAVVSVVGGLTADGLRRLASIGEERDHGDGADRSRGAGSDVEA